jgi:hypothetical protein
MSTRLVFLTDELENYLKSHVLKTRSQAIWVVLKLNYKSKRYTVIQLPDSMKFYKSPPGQVSWLKIVGFLENTP